MTAKVYGVGRGPVFIGADGVARRLAVDSVGTVQSVVTTLQPDDDVWKAPVLPVLAATPGPAGFAAVFATDGPLSGNPGWFDSQPGLVSDLQVAGGVVTTATSGFAPTLHDRGDAGTFADVTISLTFDNSGACDATILVASDATYDNAIGIEVLSSTSPPSVFVRQNATNVSTGVGWQNAGGFTAPDGATTVLRITYDGVTRILTVYQNGVQVCETSLSAIMLWPNVTKLPLLTSMPYAGFVSHSTGVTYGNFVCAGSSQSTAPVNINVPPVLDGKMLETATPLAGKGSITWNSAGYAVHDQASNGLQARVFKIKAPCNGVFAANFTPQIASTGAGVWASIYRGAPAYSQPAPPYDYEGIYAGSFFDAGGFRPVFMLEGEEWYLTVSPASIAGGPDALPAPDIDITMQWRAPTTAQTAAGKEPADAVVIAGASQSAAWSTRDMPGAFNGGGVDIPSGGGAQGAGPDMGWPRWFKLTPTVDGRVTVDVQLSADTTSVIAAVFDGEPAGYNFYPGYLPAGVLFLGQSSGGGLVTGSGTAANAVATADSFAFDALATHTYYVSVGADTPWRGAVSLSDRDWLLDVDGIVLRWNIP